MAGGNAINLAEQNPMWKGDNAGIAALHAWVKRRLPKPLRCPKCGHDGFIELACIGHSYSRDLKVWTYLCRSCHSGIDEKIVNIRAGVRTKKSCEHCGAAIVSPSRFCKPCSKQRRLDWWKGYNQKRKPKPELARGTVLPGHLPPGSPDGDGHPLH